MLLIEYFNRINELTVWIFDWAALCRIISIKVLIFASFNFRLMLCSMSKWMHRTHLMLNMKINGRKRRFIPHEPILDTGYLKEVKLCIIIHFENFKRQKQQRIRLHIWQVGRKTSSRYEMCHKNAQYRTIKVSIKLWKKDRAECLIPLFMPLFHCCIYSWSTARPSFQS